jgi:hypothetical protein
MSKNMVANVRATSIAVLVLFWGWTIGKSHRQPLKSRDLPLLSSDTPMEVAGAFPVNWQGALFPKAQALVHPATVPTRSPEPPI